MCGIIGIINSKGDVVQDLLQSLKNLEYRGYDSSGIATISNHKIELVKAKGKIKELEQQLTITPISGKIGIGHTRWATHGAPTQNNAHPHITEAVAVVHNGIIENFSEIKIQLENNGVIFTTQTDSEVIPKLITQFLNQGQSEIDAVTSAIKQLTGAFAIAIIFANNPNLLIVSRKGSPLAVGYGVDAVYIGSDSYVLAPLVDFICYLEEEDIAVLTLDGISIYNHNQFVTRPTNKINKTTAQLSKGNYPHFMLKEIYEQPTASANCLNAYFCQERNELNLDLPFNISSIPKITIIACGTSYYGGLIARSWLETIVKIPVEVEIASEFRYRNMILPQDGLCIFISQSGETADTIAALKLARDKKQHILSIVNVAESTMARLSDCVLNIYAGAEIGVASTKAFIAQLITLGCLTAKLSNSSKLPIVLTQVPGRIAEILNNGESYKAIALSLINAPHILYTGRGSSYAVCLEGALKMKELSYIPAEAIAAGELKHGTIALIDANVPIIAIAPSDSLFEKTASNLEEIAARGGKIILLSDAKGCSKLQHITYKSVVISACDELIVPIIYAIPLQLIAYYTALAKGTDIDQPRNLAKSVTVE
jgi:glucosamine--fructose-6-phosphate aminotransferase (isomerizing)